MALTAKQRSPSHDHGVGDEPIDTAVITTPNGSIHIKPFVAAGKPEFRAVLTFAPRHSSFDRENVKSQRDEFRGFFTLFWIGECERCSSDVGRLAALAVARRWAVAVAVARSFPTPHDDVGTGGLEPARISRATLCYTFSSTTVLN